MEFTLKEPAFRFFSVRDFQPQGWLRRQLEIQAEGLSGHLDEFWPSIRDSQWIGGDCDGWERVPYWLDGFIPLAWLLDDDGMKARAKRYVDAILERQFPDGWICPCSDEERGSYDMWALFLLLKVLTVYHDASDDPRVEEAVYRALKNFSRNIDTFTLFGWAQSRWFECLIPIFWLYERRPEEWMIDLCYKLSAQGFGFQEFYKHWPYTEKVPRGIWSQMSHVVNQAMALRADALFSRVSGDARDRTAADRMMALLDEYHGMVTGAFTGDECLAGKSPVQGTELCAIVEYMYSLEHLTSILGSAAYGDRLERLVFNCLPATMTPDMWAHQYVQQVNQVECSIRKEPIFTTNGGDAHIFGLEPEFGCCTANFNQGWPKFTMSTLMKAPEGVAVISYAPNRVTTQLGGAQVCVEVRGMYPFRDTAEIVVTADRGVSFDLLLRIPAWADSVRVCCGGKTDVAAAGTFYRLPVCIDGAQVTVQVALPMRTLPTGRPNGLCALTRGPLVYSLKIEDRFEQIRKDMPGREFPHCDYEVFAESPWNYGISGDNILYEEHTPGDPVFSPDGAPCSLRVPCRPIDWPMINGHAAPEPVAREPLGDEELLTFLPYGCTNLRLTELPYIG